MVQLKMKGYSQRQAYREVYDNNMTDTQVDEEASRIFNSPKVVARYEELVNELKDANIMSAKERMLWLSEVVKDIQTEETLTGVKKADLNTKIKAIDTLNKMDNSYQQNINIKGVINDPFENMTTEELRETIESLKNG